MEVVTVRVVLLEPPGETVRGVLAKEAVTPGGRFWADRATVTAASPVELTMMVLWPLAPGAIGGRVLGWAAMVKLTSAAVTLKGFVINAGIAGIGGAALLVAPTSTM